MKGNDNNQYYPQAPPPYPTSDMPPSNVYMPPMGLTWIPVHVSSVNQPLLVTTQDINSDQKISVAPPTTYLQPGTTVIQSPVTVVAVTPFSPYPVQMNCPHCRSQVMTSTKPVTGTLTWLVAGGLCLLGCWLGCCLIPFCADGCQDIEHYCPSCNAHLGTYKRM